MRSVKLAIAAAVAGLLALGGAASRAAPDETVTIGTAGPGSIVYVWVTSLAQALENIHSSVHIRVNAGVYDVEALRVLGAGGAGINASYVSGDALINATRGLPPFRKPITNLRGAFPLGLGPGVIVARASSGIKSLKDLDGKRITGGPRGTGNDVTLRHLIAKVAPNVHPDYVPLPHSAFSSALQDGKIDAAYIVGWPPYPAVVEAAALMKLNFVQLTPKELKTWLAAHPEHHRMVLKARMNPQQKKDIVTFGHVSHLIVTSSINSDAMYTMTKAWLNPKVRKQLLKASSTWESSFQALKSGLYFDDLKAFDMKLDPGAAKAMKEAGVKVPKDVMP